MIMHSCVPRTLCTWWSSVASYAKNISLSLSVVADTSVISFLCILWCCDSFNVSVDETNIVLVPTIMWCTVCTVVYSPGSQDQEEDNQPQHWLHTVLHWHTTLVYDTTVLTQSSWTSQTIHNHHFHLHQWSQWRFHQIHHLNKNLW